MANPEAVILQGTALVLVALAAVRIVVNDFGHLLGDLRRWKRRR